MGGPAAKILGDLLIGVAKKAALPVAGIGAGAAVGALLSKTKRPFVDNIFNAPGYFVFPEDLERFQISMCFQFMKYKRRSIFEQLYEEASDTIRLPVPKNIVDKFKVDWDDSVKDEPIVGAVLENFVHAEGAAERTSIPVAGGVDVAQRFLSGAPLGITLDKVLQPFGMAVNPFLTVLFKQPNFKRHMFTWKLIPKSPDEAARINGIIQTFKYHMLPDIAMNSAGSILNYPDMVQISFHGKDNYLYRFKKCVIESMEVNYAPQGVSFFKGYQNVPTEIDLQISLLEIEYWTKVDFEKGYIPNTNPS